MQCPDLLRVVLYREQKARLEREERQRRAAADRAAHAARQRGYRRNSDLLHVYQAICVTCCPAVLLCIFTGFMVNRLHVGGFTTWGDWSPIIALMSILFCGLCCMCYVKCMDPPIPFDDQAFKYAPFHWLTAYE